MTSVVTVGSHHGHLWTLLDGTPAHAPPGELTRNSDGELACHLCGRWFSHLGSHLRSHGWTATQYREAVGLSLHISLCSEQLSATIAKRQTRRWSNDPSVREYLAVGQRLAQAGELAQRAADARRDRDRNGRLSGPVRAARARTLAEGRQTMRARREAKLSGVIEAAGAIDLSDLLRSAYRDGATLDSLARLTGLGREQLSTRLEEARVPVRRAGHNLPQSKHDRARRINDAVAANVGTDDITRWLTEQWSAGRSAAALAALTGRSIPWVRSRLRGTTTTTTSVGATLAAPAAGRPRRATAGASAALDIPVHQAREAAELDAEELEIRAAGAG